MYCLRAFRAIDDLKTCERFYSGHHGVLSAYGVTQITSASVDWFHNPGVYGVIAESDDGSKVYGGVKIHVANKVQPLPVETAVGYMDEKVYDYIESYHTGGAGEACGLWNSREVAGMGISTLLMLAIVSITNQIGVKTLFGLSSDHTIKLFRKIGYRVVKSLGNNGDFVYPTPEYLARVIKMDTIKIKSADPQFRQRIFELRELPEQNYFENVGKGGLNIQYKLRLPEHL